MSRAKNLINKSATSSEVKTQPEYIAVTANDYKEFRKMEAEELKSRIANNARLTKIGIQNILNKYLAGELEVGSFETDFMSAKSEGRLQILIAFLPYLTQRFDTEKVNEETNKVQSTTATIEIEGVKIEL